MEESILSKFTLEGQLARAAYLLLRKGIPVRSKEIWESIQQNKEAFSKQIDKWIKDGVTAIRNYADGKDNDFQKEQGNAVAWGIIAKA